MPRQTKTKSDHQPNLKCRNSSGVAGLLSVGGAGFSFADGHAEIHKWLDKRTYPKINKGNMPNRVKSMMNSPDLYWMMEHSTRKVGR
ncbi:MAG: hypothetical protein ABGY13_03855 [Verrucomicrobiia bacterium]